MKEVCWQNTPSWFHRRQLVQLLVERFLVLLSRCIKLLKNAISCCINLIMET